MRLKYVMSTTPKEGRTLWEMGFDTGNSFLISQEIAHQLIGALVLKNLAPTGDTDKFGIIVNKFQALNTEETKERAFVEPKCLNCRHWRGKSWTDKGWGKCDNPANEVKAGPLAMIRYYLKDDPKAAEELALEVEDGIRYPEDFGCIFFEADPLT